MSEAINLINVTPSNVADVGIFCIKNKKAPGFHAKVDWFKKKINAGLRIMIVSAESPSGDSAKTSGGKSLSRGSAKTSRKNKPVQLGFIEYIPSEKAWRPITAKDYFFIQCIALFGKGGRNQGVGSMLIKAVEEDAKANGKSGICTMSSDGPWMATKAIFEKNGFEVVEKLGRFELMVKKFDVSHPSPTFNNWEAQLTKYKGWHLVYADQCPWHDKSVADLFNTALDFGIDLKIKKLKTPAQAQKAPSGFGTFSLIKDGKLLADHYISKTRFRNIVKSENQD